MRKKIAFFDFDGTITTKDTLLEFIKFSKGRMPFYIGFLLNSPYLIAYKLKLISNQRAKEKVLSYFLKNIPVKEFQAKCDEFAETVIPFLLREKAKQEFEKLKKDGFEIVIISASPENWIRNWCEKTGLKLIATVLQINGGRITGKIEGKNCHGSEKVRRIKELYSLNEYEEIFAYGDTSGDKPMLQLAHHAFYKPFR